MKVLMAIVSFLVLTGCASKNVSGTGQNERRARFLGPQTQSFPIEFDQLWGSWEWWFSQQLVICPTAGEVDTIYDHNSSWDFKIEILSGGEIVFEQNGSEVRREILFFPFVDQYPGNDIPLGHGFALDESSNEGFLCFINQDTLKTQFQFPIEDDEPCVKYWHYFIKRDVSEFR